MKKKGFCQMAFLFVLAAGCGGCHRQAPDPQDDQFLERMNAASPDGDYYRTYPLSSPDSCIAKLKAEVPPDQQSYGCLSLWYRLPRTDPAVSFRLLKLYEENYPHDTVFAFTQMMRAEFYVSLAKFDSARICLADARDRYLRLGRPLDAGDADLLMGRSYTYQNNFASALEMYFKALDALNAEDTSFSERHAMLLPDIAVAYERSGNNPKAIIWEKKCWNADLSKLAEPWKYKRRIARTLGITYLKVNPDSSLWWTQQSIAIHDAHFEPPVPARLVYALARAYFMKKEYAKALPHFQDAYRRNPNVNEPFVYYQYGLAMGECMVQLGKLDSAEQYIKESLASPDTGNLAASYRIYKELYVKRGDYKRAVEAADEGKRLYDIKFNADKMKAMADMETRYETAQKERRISELEQQQRLTRQRNLIVALALALALGGVLFLFYRQRLRSQLAEARELLQIRELEIAKTDLQRSEHSLKTTQAALDTTSQSLALKNLLIEELEMRLTSRHLAPSEEAVAPSAASETLRSMKILTNADWSQFRARFEQNFPGFLHQMKMRFPTMTGAEIRLFLFVKLNFEKKEIAETLGISPESVVRSRYRLGKKLDLSETGNLDVFIRQFG